MIYQEGLSEMDELISVIVPVYNVEKYLEACINSILCQTYKNIEIILVDDGATDRSGKICDLYLKKDSRIKVIHKENGGLSDARNYGMKAATGECLVFVDSDDIVSADYVLHLYQLCKVNKTEIAVCQFCHCTNQSNAKFTLCQTQKVYSSKAAIINMLYQKDILVSVWSKIFRRKIFDQTEFPVGLLFEDSAVMYRLFEKAKSIVVSDAKLYGYVHRNDSITTKKFSKKNLDILIISKTIFNYYCGKDKDLEDAARSYLVVAALRSYLNCPNEIDFKTDIEEAKQIIDTNGRQVLRDNNIRRKLRLSLILYFFARPAIKIIYKHVNRWK